ncbi:MAG: hypothetical protein ACRELG_03745 [Gemmataceae bacterium]
MLRKVGLLGILGLLMAAAPLRVGDAFTIKPKKSSKGAVTQHEKKVTVDSHVKVEGPDGKIFKEEKNSKTTIEEYKETILAKETGKRVTQLRRVYSRAVVKADGKEKTLPYEGKTLLIEKKGDKYHFTIENGEELKGEDAKSLDCTFNTPNGHENDDEELEKALLPKKPVAVNETWKIEPAEVLKYLWKGSEPVFPLDESKATAQGKLLRAYKKDGRQYGVFDIDFSAPIKGDFSLGKDEKAPFEEGSKMGIRFKVDCCIDGTAGDGMMVSFVNIDGVLKFKTPDGQEFKLTNRAVQKTKERTTDLARK